MGSFAAVYIQSARNDALEDKLGKQKLGSATLRKAGEWTQLDLRGALHRVQPLTTQLSCQLDGEVIGVRAQTVSDSYSFWMYEHGRSKCSFVFGMLQERMWEEVSGDPKALAFIFNGNVPTAGSRKSGLSTYRFFDLMGRLGLPGFGSTQWSYEVSLGE